ncbi:MAG: hypothetical protein EWM72_02757 [Nitrospira sp.]|nr:MAG: hypothetical protein EWM72_02757 [Nitrospira sp.]
MDSHTALSLKKFACCKLLRLFISALWEKGIKSNTAGGYCVVVEDGREVPLVEYTINYCPFCGREMKQLRAG